MSVKLESVSSNATLHPYYYMDLIMTMVNDKTIGKIHRSTGSMVLDNNALRMIDRNQNARVCVHD